MSKSDGSQEIEQTGLSDRVTAAYSVALDKAGGAAETVSANPLAALLGGLAIGAIAGALLPRLAKEKELLAPLGERISEAARAAIEAGKTAGKEALVESNLSTDALKAQVNKLVEQALDAASSASIAAANAAREAATR
jgi:hypothetical protein